MKGINSETEYRWYILHTYSGYENLVKTNLEQLIANNSNYQDEILDIKILTETIIEDKNGKKKAYESKVMPCYVYVKMRYSPQLWFTLTNTRGVTGFVGPQGKACSLTEEEVKRLGLETKVENFDMIVGDSVKAMSGPFEGMVGVINSIDNEHQKAGVTLNMFGREVSVDMEFYQIEKLNNPTVVQAEAEEE